MIAYDRLSQMIPPEIALADKALSVSFQQVTGIAAIKLSTFGIAVSGMSNISDLNAVNALTTAVPPQYAQYYVTAFGVPRNDPPIVKMVDVIGTPSGYIHTNALKNTVLKIESIDTAYLQTIYETMLNVVNGVYDQSPPPVPPAPPVTETIIPSGTPGAGTYATHDEAILALIAVAQSEIVNLQSLYPTETTEINKDFIDIATQLVTEKNQQAKANLKFPDLTPNDQNSIFGFMSSLPDLGLDISPNGTKDFLTNVSDQNTQFGQSIIGTLREGKNSMLLDEAGLKSNNIIPL